MWRCPRLLSLSRCSGDRVCGGTDGGTVWYLVVGACRRRMASLAAARVESGAQMSYSEAKDILLAPPPPLPPPSQEPDDEEGHTADERRWRKRKAWFERLNLLPESAKVVHVAGSKGKGSVVELLRCGLMQLPQSHTSTPQLAASKGKVGVFTSPHLHSVRERIRVGDSLISPTDLARHTQSLLGAFVESGTEEWILFFDRLLAVALKHFAEEQCDWVVLEVGVGGRYDSTNHVDPSRVAAAVITSVSMDHQNLLGNTLAEIAWQKGGILKPRCVAFTPASQAPSVLQTLSEISEQTGAKLQIVPTEAKEEEEEEGESESASSPLYPEWVVPENAELACAVLSHLFPAQDRASILATMGRAFWPGRFEQFMVPIPPSSSAVSEGESRSSSSSDDRPCRVIIDGAHNPHSMRALMNRVVQQFPAARVQVVFGCCQDKAMGDLLTVLKQFDPSSPLLPPPYSGPPSYHGLVLVRFDHPRSASPQALAELVPGYWDGRKGRGGSATASGTTADPKGRTVAEGIDFSLLNVREQREHVRPIGGAGAREDDVVVVCGSLFVVAEARKHLFKLCPEAFSKDDWVAAD